MLNYRAVLKTISKLPALPQALVLEGAQWSTGCCSLSNLTPPREEMETRQFLSLLGLHQPRPGELLWLRLVRLLSSAPADPRARAAAQGPTGSFTQEPRRTGSLLQKQRTTQGSHPASPQPGANSPPFHLFSRPLPPSLLPPPPRHSELQVQNFPLTEKKQFGVKRSLFGEEDRGAVSVPPAVLAPQLDPSDKLKSPASTYS